MILSVSRRTDIPALYSKWFVNRIKEGYAYVRNPFNPLQIGKVNIRPEIVDCIVFWSKDPKPLMEHLDKLADYHYYFQFTITPYGKDIEANLRSKREILDTFIELSAIIGAECNILRYDPILLTDRYTLDFHKRSFQRLCERVSGHTERIVISFVDNYRKISRNMQQLSLKEITNQQINDLAGFFVETASQAGIELQTCAEEYDLLKFGIVAGKCIDSNLVQRITGQKLKHLQKDGSRSTCLCDQSIDIGQYNSCINGCAYCYANTKPETAVHNYNSHTVDSPILFGDYDKSLVKERRDAVSWIDLGSGDGSWDLDLGTVHKK